MMNGLTANWTSRITMAKATGNQIGAPRKGAAAKPTARTMARSSPTEGSDRRNTKPMGTSEITSLSKKRCHVQKVSGSGQLLHRRHHQGGGQHEQEGARDAAQLEADQAGGEGDEGPDLDGRGLDVALDGDVLDQLVADEGEGEDNRL